MLRASPIPTTGRWCLCAGVSRASCRLGYRADAAQSLHEYGELGENPREGSQVRFTPHSVF